MKRFSVIALALIAVASANAEVYVFTPTPVDMDDLDHYKYYTWGIDWTKPADETIVSATLEFKNIYNWQEEENHLYIHLLDNPQLGFKTFTDDQGGGDAFAGQGALIGVFSDPGGGTATNFDLVYDFAALNLIDDLDAYVADGRFGFGMDPDCHYFNDGVKFTITTQPVPEPATLGALGLGVVALLRRRKR